MLQLKAAHRSLAERAESFRQDAMDAKTQDGQSSLQLHNIEYEAAQHGKEVKSCKAFTSAYADADLALPDGEMGGADIADDATPHQLQLQRLTKELKQRQELQAQEAALKTTRSAVGDDLEGQRSALRRLGQQLQALGTAGKQLASSLEGPESNATSALLSGGAAVAATAPLLPVPLYVLYSQVCVPRVCSTKDVDQHDHVSQAIAAKSAHELDMTVVVDGQAPESASNALITTDAADEMVWVARCFQVHLHPPSDPPPAHRAAAADAPRQPAPGCGVCLSAGPAIGHRSPHRPPACPGAARALPRGRWPAVPQPDPCRHGVECGTCGSTIQVPFSVQRRGYCAPDTLSRILCG